MSYNGRFAYNKRNGNITDAKTGELLGTELNGATVIDVDGFLVTVAEIAWTIYHGSPQKHQRVIPIEAHKPLAISNLKLVDVDNIKARFDLPGYMEVVQDVLDVNTADAVELEVEEPEPEATYFWNPKDFIEKMPNGKYRAYYMLNSERVSCGEFKKKNAALRCAEFHHNKPKP